MIVVPLAAGASADLVKIARTQDRGLLAVVLAEPRKQNGADRHVDADAQGVGTADHFEQPPLRQSFDQHAVFGQQARVVQSDAVTQPALDFRPVRAAEPIPLQRLGQRGLFLAGGGRQAGKTLRAFGSRRLREMHDVHRTFPGGNEGFHGLGKRGLDVLEFQRDGAESRPDGDRRPAVETGQFLLEKSGVAERGGHQEEACLREGQQRDLPGAAAFAVAVVVELIENDIVNIRTRALAQRQVGKNLGRTAEDWRIAVDGAVTRRKTDVLRTELPAKREPFFVDQSLDRARVDRTPTLGQGLELERRRHERFARTCGRIEDDIVLVEQLQDRGFLRRIKIERGGR